MTLLQFRNLKSYKALHMTQFGDVIIFNGATHATSQIPEVV
jgi:hypothetical protein